LLLTDRVAKPAMTRPALLDRLARQHAQRAEHLLLRRLRVVEACDGATIMVDGKRLLNFASNDYLGLAQHAAVRESLIAAANRWGTGAGAAHLLGGHRQPHAQLEDDLARWTGRERALLFSTGYMANLGVFAALMQAKDLCIADKLNHASLLDGARLAGCQLRRYRHADIESARRQLHSQTGVAALLATDGVFSMDGDIAPLDALSALCIREQATLMVDDAHGLGVIGPNGAGSVAEAALDQQKVPVLMATLGKALGVCGAFIAGSAALIEGLLQFARTYIYTTALPPAIAAAASTAVSIAQTEGWRRADLQQRIAQFRSAANHHGWQLLPSRSAIQPLLIGDSATAIAVAAGLENVGFYVPAIRPPTVPAGQSRLRITLSAQHSEADVASLVAALSTLLTNLNCGRTA
jgi:8-amino-7-oxononanoate synthase